MTDLNKPVLGTTLNVTRIHEKPNDILSRFDEIAITSNEQEKTLLTIQRMALGTSGCAFYFVIVDGDLEPERQNEHFITIVVGINWLAHFGIVHHFLGW